MVFGIFLVVWSMLVYERAVHRTENCQACSIYRAFFLYHFPHFHICWLETIRRPSYYFECLLTVETVFSNMIIRNRIALSFEDIPGKPFEQQTGWAYSVLLEDTLSKDNSFFKQATVVRPTSYLDALRCIIIRTGMGAHKEPDIFGTLSSMMVIFCSSNTFSRWYSTKKCSAIFASSIYSNYNEALIFFLQGFYWCF